MGAFNCIFAERAGKAGEPDRIMIDAAHLKAHRVTGMRYNAADRAGMGVAV